MRSSYAWFRRALRLCYCLTIKHRTFVLRFRCRLRMKRSAISFAIRICTSFCDARNWSSETKCQCSTSIVYVRASHVYEFVAERAYFWRHIYDFEWWFCANLVRCVARQSRSDRWREYSAAFSLIAFSSIDFATEYASSSRSRESVLRKLNRTNVLQVHVLRSYWAFAKDFANEWFTRIR